MNAGLDIPDGTAARPRALLEALRNRATGLATRHAWWLHAAALVVAVLAIWAAWAPAVSVMRLVTPAQEQVTLPYYFKNGRNAYVFEGTLTVGLRTRPYLTLVADDCVESITVDGRRVYSSGCAPCENCQFKRLGLGDVGFGAHNLVIVVKDHGGSGQLDIREADGVGGLQALVMLVVALGCLYAARRTGRSAAVAWVVVLGMGLTSYYHLCTDSHTRQHDVAGHKEYIEHLLNARTLPRVTQGWETWQPPGYYAVAAVFSRATEFLGVKDLHRRVQVMAAMMYALCIIIAAFAWRTFQFSREAGWFGLVLFVMMPAHVYVSGRVNNDVMMPFWGMVVTLLSWHYVRLGRLRTVVALGAVLLFAMITKTSSMSLVAGAGLALLYKDHVDRRGLVSRGVRSAILGMPAALWVLYWFARNKEQTGEWVYVNANLQDSLRVPNSAYKFLGFDWQTFMSEGYFNTFGGKMRETFPASLAASLLTGEFNLEWIPASHQSFLRAAFIPVLLLLVVGLFTRPGWRERPWVPALLVFAAHAFFMINYNWKYAYACNQDARLWGPAYFPAAVLWSWGYEAALARFTGRVRRFLKLAPFVFLALLAWFWLRFLLP